VDAAGRASPGGTGSSDRAVVSFRDRELFSLHDKAGHHSVRERSLPMIHELNRLWKSHRAVSIRAARLAGNRARLEIDGVTVIETLPGDAAGEDPLIVASRWAQALRQAYHSGPWPPPIASTKGP
jgi:hypothetical protein